MKWTYKKCKNFNIYNVVFLFKKLKLKTPGDIIILHLCTKNLDDMIYSSWVWQTEIGNYGPFLPFISPKTPKNQNFEKMKKIAGYHHFTRVSKTNHIKYGSWNMEWDEIFCHFGPFFTLLPPPPSQNRKSNFSKIKKASGDVIILHICTKNHYHMMYASWDMECERQFFVTLCHFCPFTPLLTPKTKIWKKCKKNPGDTIILHMRTIN